LRSCVGRSRDKFNDAICNLDFEDPTVSERSVEEITEPTEADRPQPPDSKILAIMTITGIRRLLGSTRVSLAVASAGAAAATAAVPRPYTLGFGSGALVLWMAS